MAKRTQAPARRPTARAAKPAAARRKPTASRAKAARTPKPAKGSPVVGALGLVTLHVTDLARAVTFYRDALQLPAGEVVDTPGMGWAEFDLGGIKLGLHADRAAMEEGARAPGGSTGFYFIVPDVDRSVATLRERGAKITHEPDDMPYGREATFTDPDGNLLALLTPRA